MNGRELLQQAISENSLTEGYGQAISPQTQPTNTGATISAWSHRETTTNLSEKRNLAPSPSRTMSWAEWKAETLNTLFQQYGRSGQRGRITLLSCMESDGGAQIEAGGS